MNKDAFSSKEWEEITGEKPMSDNYGKCPHGKRINACSQCYKGSLEASFEDVVNIIFEEIIEEIKRMKPRSRK